MNAGYFKPNPCAASGTTKNENSSIFQMNAGHFQNKKTAYIFPGQGSQYIGMGRGICERYPEAMSIFDKASEALGFDLKGLCFQGPEETLGLTTNTQPAILTTSFALWACLGMPEGAFFAGHSLGEFTALVAGGALDLETAVLLVRDRGRLMQEGVPPGLGAMAAVIGLSNEDVEGICKDAWDSGRVWPANYNSPGQVVISGEKKGVTRAIELAKQKGAKRSVILPVSIPSHCPLMEGAAVRLEEMLAKVVVKDLKIPVVSNCWAEPVKQAQQVKRNMVQQMTSPVRWADCIVYMINESVERFVEIGPGKVLTDLIKRIDRDAETVNVSDLNGIERFAEGFR